MTRTSIDVESLREMLERREPVTVLDVRPEDQCAEWRLEGLGFEKVYDYVPGKADWFANGLPKEGKLAGVSTIGDVARRNAPTCPPTEKVGAAWERVRNAGWDACIVVNKERVVLGLLREQELASDREAVAEEVMRTGPATFRPNEPVRKVAERMHKRGAATVAVTTSDSRLVGLLYREDAECLADKQSS